MAVTITNGGQTLTYARTSTRMLAASVAAARQAYIEGYGGASIRLGEGESLTALTNAQMAILLDRVIDDALNRKAAEYKRRTDAAAAAAATEQQIQSEYIL